MCRRPPRASSRLCLVALLLLGPLLAPATASAQLGDLLDRLFDDEEGSDAEETPESSGEEGEAAPALEPGVCPEVVTPEMASQGWPDACGTLRSPDFANPSVDPMIHLEGLWSLQFVDCPVLSEGLTYLGKGRYGLGGREAGKGWMHSGMARMTESGEVGSFGSGNVTVGPDGSISMHFVTYGFSGRPLTGNVRPASGSDVLVGEWTWSGHRGPLVWRRRPSARIESVEFHSHLKDEAGNYIVDVVAHGERPGRVERDHPLSCGYGAMRANCPTMSIVVRGSGFAGAHSVWIDPATKLEPSPVWLCRGGHTKWWGAAWTNCGGDQELGDATVGLRIGFYIWDGVQPGPKTLWIDGQPVPFELVIRGFPEEQPQPPQLEELRAVGDDGERVEELDEGQVFQVEAVFDAPHPDAWIALAIPEPKAFRVFDALYSAARRVAGDAEEAEAEPPAAPTGPSVTLWREQDPSVFRSRWLRVEAAESEGPAGGEVAP